MILSSRTSVPGSNGNAAAQAARGQWNGRCDWSHRTGIKEGSQRQRIIGESHNSRLILDWVCGVPSHAADAGSRQHEGSAMRAIHLLVAVLIVAAAQGLPSAPRAQVLVNITVAPPLLPVY